MASGVFLFSLLLSVTSARTLATSFQDAEVEQHQGQISVLIGADLQLECQVPEVLPAGPVKWFLGEGRGRKLIYSNQQIAENHKRTTRVFPKSNTDFTIFIHNVTLEDSGMYHCVKQRRSGGSDRDWRKGRGTLVIVEASQESSVIPIAVGLSISLLFLLCVAALCFYKKRKRGRSSCNERSDTNFPRKQSPKQGSGVKEIVYADLKEPSRPSPPKNILSEEHSEYATIQGAPGVDREKGFIPV